MTPTELKSANIKRFECLIFETLTKEHPDEVRLQMLKRLLKEERAKPLRAYPEEAGPRTPTQTSVG